MKTTLQFAKITMIALLVFSVNLVKAETNEEVYFEDFNDGEAAGWVGAQNTEDGNWVVNENDNTGEGMQYENENGNNMISSVYDEETYENYTVSAKIYPVWGNKTGIIFNYQDDDNFYVVEHWANESKLYLREKIGGTWETGEGGDSEGGYFWTPDSVFLSRDKYMDRVATDVASEWYETGEFSNTIKIENIDGKTSVWFNDVLIFDKIEMTDLSSGKVGCFTHWCPAYFDDIKVEVAEDTGGDSGELADSYEEDFEGGEAVDWMDAQNSGDGDWRVKENENTNGSLQYENTNGNDMISSVYDGAAFENYSVSANIYPVWGNKTGIIFNYQDDDNFYVVEHWANESKLYLREKVAGVWETGEGGDSDGGYFWTPDSVFLSRDKYMDRIATDVASEWYETGEFENTIKIENADGFTSVWFNDVLIFDKIEMTEFTNGKIGCFTHWCPAYFDNIVVAPADDTGTGFSVLENYQLEMYPNPVAGNSFSIDASQFDGNANLRIFKLSGQLMVQRNISNSGTVTIDVQQNGLTSGMYIVNVTSEERVYSSKLVIN